MPNSQDYQAVAGKGSISLQSVDPEPNSGPLRA
jgi:hypothetical protein